MQSVAQLKIMEGQCLGQRISDYTLTVMRVVLLIGSWIWTEMYSRGLTVPSLLYAWEMLGAIPIVCTLIFFYFFIIIYYLFHFLFIIFISLLGTQNDWAVAQFISDSWVSCWSRISQKRCVLGTKLLRNTNRKPYTIYRMVPLWIILSDLWPRFQDHDIFEVEYRKWQSYYCTIGNYT